jgi:hypothetical protein
MAVIFDMIVLLVSLNRTSALCGGLRLGVKTFAGVVGDPRCQQARGHHTFGLTHQPVQRAEHHRRGAIPEVDLDHPDTGFFSRAQVHALGGERDFQRDAVG